MRVKAPFYLELVAERDRLREELEEARHYGNLLKDAVGELESIGGPEERISHYKHEARMLWLAGPQET